MTGGQSKGKFTLLELQIRLIAMALIHRIRIEQVKGHIKDIIHYPVHIFRSMQRDYGTWVWTKVILQKH